jgi:hypothetical protein
MSMREFCRNTMVKIENENFDAAEWEVFAEPGFDASAPSEVNNGKIIFVFRGRSNKPLYRRYLDSVLGFDFYVKEAKREAEYIAEMKKPHAIKKDDILVQTWGFEQTNQDFYKVVSVSARSVKIVPMTNDDIEYCAQAMSGKTVPGVVVEGASVITVRANARKINTPAGLDYGSMSVWDGTPMTFTTYA